MDENLSHNAEIMGMMFRKRLMYFKNDYVKDIRGVGLFNAIEFFNPTQAEEFVENCRENGVLTKVTHNSIVRMCPPLVISKSQMDESLNIIENQLLKL